MWIPSTANAAAQGYWLLLPYRPAPTQKKNLSDMIYGKTIDGILLLGADVPFRIDGDTRSTLPPMVMVNKYMLALAKVLGLRVPEELSLTGFGNLMVASPVIA